MIKKRIKKPVFIVLSIIIWLSIWQYISCKVNSQLFLPSPADVYRSTVRIVTSSSFWDIASYSIKNISLGFIYALLGGIILACLAASCSFIREFISIPINIIKAIPVASFTILALLWLDSEKLTILIAFLMGVPIIYINVLRGIDETPKNLLEMSKVFHMPYNRRFRFIYVTSVRPYLISSCEISAGMCWKSGIAAEVIGITKNSLGNSLYQSKLYLEIPDLFAYTIIIVVISVIFEKLVLFTVRLCTSIVAGMARWKQIRRASHE